MAQKPTGKSAAAARSGKSGDKKNSAGGAAAASTGAPRSATKSSSGGKASPSGSNASGRDQRVRDRAYEIWEQEGRPAGREREHWERANRETPE